MSTVAHILEFLLGVAIVLVVLNDVFQSVIVPRPADRRYRLAPPIVENLWRFWRYWAPRFRDNRRRENFLGTFGPFALIALLLGWVAALVFGYGLLFFALRDEMKPPVADFGSAVYFAGTSLFTIGFGDFVPQGGLARTVALLAGMSGLGVLAVVLSLLFSLHAAFARREVYVIALESRAGGPPSGVTLLETLAELGLAETLPELFQAWEFWSAEMLQSHLAFPLLPFFRSLRPDQSWVSSMGAVLDAATLLLTSVELENATRDGTCRRTAMRGSATLTYTLGNQTVNYLGEMFALYARYDRIHVASPATPRDVLVDRSEFDAACRRLQKAGYRLHDPEVAWNAFIAYRSTYAQTLNSLAKLFVSPPALWIGDRSIVPYRVPTTSPVSPLETASQ